MCNVSYLLAHQRLAVLQVVSLHDGRAVQFGQRMRAPTVTGRGTIDEGRSLRTCESFGFFVTLAALALSGRGCWCLCDRCRGRKPQPPWQRHRGRSSTSSACLSARKGWGEKKSLAFKSSVQKEQELHQDQQWDQLLLSLLCYLQQAEHGVAHVEAVPPVVVGDGAVTLPHRVHPSGQRLSRRSRCRKEKNI